jgi:hypothetical protein
MRCAACDLVCRLQLYCISAVWQPAASWCTVSCTVRSSCCLVRLHKGCGTAAAAHLRVHVYVSICMCVTTACGDSLPKYAFAAVCRYMHMTPHFAAPLSVVSCGLPWLALGYVTTSRVISWIGAAMFMVCAVLYCLKVSQACAHA